MLFSVFDFFLYFFLGHVQAAEGAEKVPVSFRYGVSFPESGKTHMFRPNPLGKEAAKHVTFGAAYASPGFEKMARNDRIQVVWEASMILMQSVDRAKAPGGDPHVSAAGDDEKAEVLVDLQAANGAYDLVHGFEQALKPLSERSRPIFCERGACGDHGLNG